MNYELIYTSVPQGLMPGSSGFCITAHTAGMPANLASALVSLSGYKAVYSSHSNRAGDNPVSCSHYLWDANGKNYHILSHICFAGVDYTQRDNKLAHHLVTEEAECAVAGPCAYFYADFFRREWNEEPHLINNEPQIKISAYQQPEALLWRELAGDSGYAGFIAGAFMSCRSVPVYVVCEPETDTLKLVSEVLALLQPQERWQFTFNTYCQTPPQSMECFLRFCPPDSLALKKASSSRRFKVIDLINKKFPSLDSPDCEQYVAMARNGEVIPELAASGATLGALCRNIDDEIEMMLEAVKPDSRPKVPPKSPGAKRAATSYRDTPPRKIGFKRPKTASAPKAYSKFDNEDEYVKTAPYKSPLFITIMLFIVGLVLFVLNTDLFFEQKEKVADPKDEFTTFVPEAKEATAAKKRKNDIFAQKDKAELSKKFDESIVKDKKLFRDCDVDALCFAVLCSKNSKIALPESFFGSEFKLEPAKKSAVLTMKRNQTDNSFAVFKDSTS